LLEQWNTEDPIDEWETKRAERVRAAQSGAPEPTPPTEAEAPTEAKAPTEKGA
jgi:endonuclease I